MEDSSVPLAKKVLEKIRVRQEEIDNYASPIRCSANASRISALDKENRTPLNKESFVENALISNSPPKINHFAAIAEAYNNFEYEICHKSKSKEEHQLNTIKNSEDSFELLSLNDSDRGFFVVENEFYQLDNKVDSPKKLEENYEQDSSESSLPSKSKKLEILSKVSDDEVTSVGRIFNRISVNDTKNVIHHVERNDDIFPSKNITTDVSLSITNRKAMDIAKEFDSTSRNFRTSCKQAAVKYIDGKVAVKSLRPGALSPTLLYGNRRKVDMKNSEIVIPEITSVKNLKSKWEANIISEVKVENNEKVLQSHLSDERKFSNDNTNIDENCPPEISKFEECRDIKEYKLKEEDNSNSVIKTPEVDVKCEHKDKTTNDAFIFAHLEESPLPSPVFDCKASNNLMEDINSELNKFTTPRSHLREKRQLITDMAVDSPQRQLVHSISFYRKKAKEIEEVVKHNIDSVSSDVISSSGCSGYGISSGSHNNEDVCEEYANIEVMIRKLKESIRVQQDQIAQASRAILYCNENDNFKGSREEVDAQRALLIANEKKKVLLMEYEKIKMNVDTNSLSRHSRGTLFITNIVLKLSKEFIHVHINQKANSYIYYFIVLIKIAEKVLYTQLASSDTEIKNGYIEFKVQMNLKNIPANFKGLLEIFCLRTKKDLRHVKDAKNKSKTLTPFKRFSSSASSSNNRQPNISPTNTINSSFQKIGSLSFNISHVNMKNFILKDVKQPLEGTISLNMDCIPEKESCVEYKGFLNLYQFIGDLSSWNRYWCVLKGSNMIFWKYPEEEDKKQPAIIIDLESVKGEVEHINDESACFPNTMQLRVEVLDKKKLSTIRILFAADTLSQMELWLTYINEVIKYISLWCSKKISPKK
uniref:PH domain-containing protein n=1 Tax=Strongyloides stercoralis TaxID=6248 RepID=A0A0K0DTK8_STRER